MAILVLSTNQRLAHQIERHLAAERLEVMLTATAESALKAAQQGKVGCLVIDFRGRNGIATVRRMRSAGITASIVAINTCGSAEDRMRAFQAGADDCVPDPISIQELVMRIRLLLHRSASPDRIPPGYKFAALAERYKLTAAETKVTERLLQGKDVEQISAELRVTEHTVRSQLKAIFHKTGARRQAELIWLLLTSTTEDKPEGQRLKQSLVKGGSSRPKGSIQP